MPERNLMWTGKKCAAYVFIILMLSGCSQWPDSINPVEWYNKSVEFFENRDSKPEAIKGQRKDLNNIVKVSEKVRGAKNNKEYPTIVSVDEQRDYYEARKRGGLIPDKENRKYAPAVARQGEISTRIAVAPPPEPKAKDPGPATKTISSKPPVSEQTVNPGLTASSLPSPDEQKTLNIRLQERLNEIRARAGQPPIELLTSISTTSTRDNFGTVIVNSEGSTTDQVSTFSPNKTHVKEKPLTITSAIKFGHLANTTQSVASGAVKVATIHFRNGSAALSPRDRQIIANALQLKRERGGRIHIIGHASSRTRSLDPIRHKMLNFRISVDRADAVAKELIRLGIPKEDLLVDALSDSQPMYFEFMPTGEAGNRRAEIYLES